MIGFLYSITWRLVVVLGTIYMSFNNFYYFDTNVYEKLSSKVKASYTIVEFNDSYFNPLERSKVIIDVDTGKDRESKPKEPRRETYKIASNFWKWASGGDPHVYRVMNDKE